MKGGVRKKGSSWYYYFDIGIIEGKRKKVEKGGFKTKGEAQKALTKALYEFENGGFVQAKTSTFWDYANEWLEDYIKPLRKENTYNRYKGLINNYVIEIGTLKLSDVKPYHIERLLMKHRGKVSEATLQSVYSIINTMMKRALKLKLIADNPCSGVDRPKREKYSHEVLEADEIGKLMSNLNDDDIHDYMFRIALSITFELGLRRGELSGLEWKNVDLDNNVISIRNNLVYTNGYVKMSTPKTVESLRDILISDELSEMLTQLKERQDKNKKDYGDFYEKNVFTVKLKNNKVVTREYDLVMVWENGKYIHPMYYTNKIKKTIKKAGIDKHIRFHDTRHTNATLLLSEGTDLKTVQMRLGHEDITTTGNIYSHVTKKMQQQAVNSISKALNYGGKTVANEKHQV